MTEIEFKNKRRKIMDKKIPLIKPLSFHISSYEVGKNLYKEHFSKVILFFNIFRFGTEEHRPKRMFELLERLANAKRNIAPNNHQYIFWRDWEDGPYYRQIWADITIQQHDAYDVILFDWKTFIHGRLNRKIYHHWVDVVQSVVELILEYYHYYFY
jgi:hypothetical protein